MSAYDCFIQYGENFSFLKNKITYLLIINIHNMEAKLENFQAFFFGGFLGDEALMEYWCANLPFSFPN